MPTTHRGSISWCILWKSIIFGYLDILVPIRVCEIHRVFHPWFKLVPQFYASIELSFVPFYVSFVEARRTRVFQASLFLLRLALFFITEHILIGTRSDISISVKPRSRCSVNWAISLWNFSRDVSDIGSLACPFSFKELLREFVSHLLSVLRVFCS